MKFISLWI